MTALLMTICFFGGCYPPSPDSLQRIKKAGKIRIITDNSATTYYIYRDEKMGFEYDLAKAFADHLGVELEIITPNWDDMFDALIDGHGDLIAAGLTKTEIREEIIGFSDGYLDIQQNIIVHKKNRKIKEIKDLDGVTIDVRSGTSYQDRIYELEKEGVSVDLKLHGNVSTEELIRKVAKKKIKITVADSHIAFLNRRYYPDIRIAFPINEPQELAWGVRKNDMRLIKEINKFFKKIKKNGVYDEIYRKYYANIEIFDYVDLKRFHKRLKTRLPKYEAIIRREAKKYGFDWRMIAAVIYQESHFDPNAESYTGVKGLMQVTRRTAAEMGITNRNDPEESVKAGVKYLNKLYGRFNEIEKHRERMLFALASYNIGYGHVQDARKICREKGHESKHMAFS